MAIWEHKTRGKTLARYAVFAIGFMAIGQVALHGITPVKSIALLATQNIAGIIGMAGAVSPNEYNALATQFDQKDKELAAREQALSEREQALASGVDRITLRVLFGITGLLLFLLVINFYLDWKRGAQPIQKEVAHHDELTTRL